MYHQQVTNDGYITVQIPVGMFDTGSAVPFIPIDSVYQTETDTYVFVAKDKKAVTKPIKLGNVIGSFVEVESGLASGDMIILDRSIVGGDPVSFKN
jgi:multidrug efflux pump subunit AcrA (membrane-fusion protein)